MKSHTRSVISLVETYCPANTIGCELGVWQGETSQHLLNQFPNLYLLMVDRWKVLDKQESQVTRRLGAKSQDEMNEAMQFAIDRTQLHSSRRTVLVGDSIHTSTLVRDELLDFIFIDAHHSYEACRFDIQCWWPKMKPQSLVCGHDYDGRGDRTRRFGVKRAVDEFAAEKGLPVNVELGHVWYVIK